jgi:multidrug efflux system outer membrane protein
MRHIFPGGLLLVFWAALAGPVTYAGAQEAAQKAASLLSLDRAVELALANSLDLRKRSIDLKTAEVAAHNLWAQVFPSITAGAGLNYSTPLTTGTGFQAKADNLTWSASLGLSLPLSPSLASGMKITELAYRTRLLDYENARKQVVILISNTFFNLLTEKENLVILEGDRRLAEGQFEKSGISFRNGLTRELDYLQSQFSMESARLALSRAEATYAVNLGQFLTLLGLAQDTPVTLEGRLEITRIEADAEALIREYLPRRPDIVSQRQNIEQLEYTEKQQTLSSRSPSLTLSAQWQGSPNGGMTGEFADSLRGGVSLNIPVESWIPGTRSHQSIKNAGMNVEKAKLDLQNTEIAAMQEIRTLTANLKNSWGNIEIARFRVDLAERTYRLTEQGYQSGTVEYQDLETSRNTMASARQQLLEGELAYKTMMLNLSAALNIDQDELAAGWGAASEDITNAGSNP